jgi:hypothetical protein
MWARTCATDREDRSGSPDGGLCNERAVAGHLPARGDSEPPPTCGVAATANPAGSLAERHGTSSAAVPKRRNERLAQKPAGSAKPSERARDSKLKGLASSTLSSRTTPPRRSASSCSGLASIIAVLFLSINASFLQ